MTKRSVKIRPTMTYEVMDIFNMTYPSKSFDAILDKGLLDAVYPEDTQENSVKINGLFERIADILGEGGNARYVAVSLL